MRLALLHDLTRQTAGLEVATGLGGLAVAAVGAPLVLHGWIEPSLLPLLVLVSIAAFLPVSEIAQVGRQLADTIASTRRLHVVHSEPVVITDGPRVPAAPRGGSTVRFEHVRFTYPGRQRAALANVDFDVPAGATVALVGPSGAGKTTIANLLLRLLEPTSGRITVDGRDLATTELSTYRRQLGVVEQNPYLFGGTIRENIGRTDSTAGIERIAGAATVAGASEFIDELPLRYETQIGERGVTLSGGQRQRIVIARALLNDPRILLLDEATSALDSESERVIQDNLDNVMSGRTCFVIAHRLSTVRNADRILVIDEGRIVESGAHDALMAANGIYASMNTRPPEES
jgi:ATP-binding cassette subfamily C protein CydCD